MADETALWLKTHPGAPEEDAVLSLYFDVLRYLKVAELYDGHYRTLLTFAKGDITARQVWSTRRRSCPDAFQRAERRLFSATLTPCRIIGNCSAPGRRRRPSSSPLPFPTREPLPAHRRPGQHPVPGSDRQRRAGRTDDRCRHRGESGGTIWSFFPSYAYMREVYEAFSTLYPDQQTVLQAPNMKEAEREAFLEQFEARPQASILGFCVLGGIYSEGSTSRATA